MSNKVHI